MQIANSKGKDKWNRYFRRDNDCEGPCERVSVTIGDMSPETRRLFNQYKLCGMCFETKLAEKVMEKLQNPPTCDDLDESALQEPNSHREDEEIECCTVEGPIKSLFSSDEEDAGEIDYNSD